MKELYDRDMRNQIFREDLWLIKGRSKKGEKYRNLISKIDDIEILINHLPHMIDFPERVGILRKLIEADKAKQDISGHFYPDNEIAIRRDYILEDSFHQLHKLGKNLKSHLNV